MIEQTSQRDRWNGFDRLSRTGFGVATFVFSLSGLGKLILVLFDGPLKNGSLAVYPNAVFPILNNGSVAVLGSIVELGVVIGALYAVRQNRPLWGMALLAWLATLVGFYRMALWFTEPGTTCDCFGVFGRMIYPSDHGAGFVSFVLYGLIAVTYLPMYRFVRAARKHAAVPEATRLQ